MHLELRLSRRKHGNSGQACHVYVAMMGWNPITNEYTCEEQGHCPHLQTVLQTILGHWPFVLHRPGAHSLFNPRLTRSSIHLVPNMGFKFDHKCITKQLASEGIGIGEYIGAADGFGRDS